MFTVMSIYTILKTKDLAQLDRDAVKIVAIPIVLGLLLAIGLDISIIKFIITH